MVCPINCGIASRIDTRLSIEGIYFKTCIIGKAVISIMLIYILGLLYSITLKGVMCFRKFFMATYFL